MGIGRFAFTPILPMMLHDGVVDLAHASLLASTNYVGYLVGALLCTFDPWLRRRLGVRRPADGPAIVRYGLAATALLTLAMALPWPAAWPTLRFAAGAVSAYVLLQSSGWCLAQLAARGKPQLGGVMFAGPGAGIVGSGLLGGAMVSWQWLAGSAWIVFGVLAALLTAAVWNVFRREHEAPLQGGAGLPAGAATAGDPGVESPAQARHGSAEVAVLAVAYGIAGFGYIVTATFLPVIARAAIAGSPLIDLFWPIFGGGIVCGALLSARVSPAIDRRWLLAAAYLLQASGIFLGVAWPTEAGFALGSLMLGFPFTTLTLFALQEARRIRPLATASTMGLVTTVYALGQALGPGMVAFMLQLSGGDAHAAFQRSLVVAASSLLIGAAMYAASARAWPAAR
ncbi:MAG: YbfB/YjiJ family MFS transporter [Burkholderiales bacterium]|nr:YbfB/YjiJ family MFS transporter [Burkholderiales bacterium]